MSRRFNENSAPSSGTPICLERHTLSSRQPNDNTAHLVGHSSYSRRTRPLVLSLARHAYDVAVGHALSSEASPQSSVPSHHSLPSTQRPLSHVRLPLHESPQPDGSSDPSGQSGRRSQKRFERMQRPVLHVNKPSPQDAAGKREIF